MDEEVRLWLLSELESWLSTWEEIPESPPQFLSMIVNALRNKRTKFTSEAFNEILFHLWQISLGKED